MSLLLARRGSLGKRRGASYADLPASPDFHHRGSGAPAIFPEHTAEAYRQSIAVGADVLDLDVLRTSDGVLIVYHDPTFTRTSGVAGNVASTTYAALPTVTMPKYTGQGWAAQPIPTVEEILDEFGGQIVLNIEPKTLTDVNDLISLVQARGLQDTVLINTYHTATVATATAAGLRGHVWSVDTTAKVDAAVAAGASIIEIPYGAALTSGLVTYAKAQPGVDFVICNPLVRRYERDIALATGVDSVVSDAPGYILQTPDDRSIAAAVAAQKVSPGWWRTDYVADWFNANGVILGGTGAGFGAAPRNRFGNLCGPKPGTYSITWRYSYDAVVDIGGRIGLRFCLLDDRGTGTDGDTALGYEVHVRASGQFQAYKGGLGSFTQLGSNISTGVVTSGQIIEVRADITPTTVTLTRVDTGHVLGPFTDSTYRGDYHWVLGHTLNEPTTLHSMEITTP